MIPGPHGLAPGKGRVEAALTARVPDAAFARYIFDPLVDSAEIGPHHWNRMLEAIDEHPGVPVLITHGTDTLSYTAAALSAALACTERRIILCGAMQPLGANGDAENNLDLAIAALNDQTPGVFLAFGGAMRDAVGLVKHDSSSTDAFRNLPQAPLQSPVRRRFDGRRLAILTISPGLPSQALRAMLAELDGAVLRIFGTGTLSSDPDTIAALTDAVAAGKVLRAASQCEAGGLRPGTYGAGCALWSAGVQNGGQQTPEMALVHLWLSA